MALVTDTGVTDEALPNVVTGATKGGNGKYLKTVIYDAQGRIASAVVEGTIGGTTPLAQGTSGSEGSSEAVARVDHVHPGLSIYDVWKAEAAADLGIAPSGLVFIILGDGGVWLGSGLQANGGTRVAASDGFGQRLTSGGSANGTSNLYFQPFSTAVMLHVVAGASAKFWQKIRMAVNNGTGGPVGAATVLGLTTRSTGTNNGTHEMAMGVDGAASTSNFVVSATAGATIDSGLAIDSLVRDHKVYRANGTDTVYRIDSLSPVTGTARPNASGHASAMAFDSAAVNQVVDVYLAAIAFPVRALGA